VRSVIWTLRQIPWLVLLSAASFGARGAEIDMTRYVGRHAADAEVVFFGVAGPARLLVSKSTDAQISLRLNDADVEIGPGTSSELSVTLAADNTLTLTLTGELTEPVTVRVKQVADIELHVDSRVHFNTNVSDFEAARAFYGMLGFETLTGFPDTNTLEMAQAIGVATPTGYDGSQGEAAGGYLLHGELIGVNGFRGGVIDLIEFTIPRNEAPPYAKLNHLGMARAAMHSADIDADHARLSKAGVEFLTVPTTRADGTRFAVFKDLDGTHYELIEVDAEVDPSTSSQIVSLAQVNVNVSDFERSRAWYQMLGYDMTSKLPPTDSLDVARAMGFAAPYNIDGAILTHRADGSMLEVVQWITPYDPEPAYPIPVNHLGIHRMAFATTDIEADVAALKAQGVEFVSPITPCCSGPESWGSIVAFYDPDGTIVELVEQPYLMTKMLSIFMWLRGLFS
jgi:catechol 2,3-dioxygenase-like lactoylglutathione lyase family enzyme